MFRLLSQRKRVPALWRAAHSAGKSKLAELKEVKRIEDECKEGAEIEGFLVNKVAKVAEFNMTVVRLRHVRTGCDYLHLARDDINNVFAVGFRTTPLNSMGVAHVLEHMVLCGSSKYPVKDPFFKMSGRSMASFMNAMTGPDFTLFPFATPNQTDYKNLVSVYMDAVFRPRLRELDFLQEGWRFEHEVPNDRKTPIVVRGQVYSEMKEVLSENSVIFSNAILNNLLPSHTYGVLSGGDPKVIPDLTLSDLKDFHKKYYHPSNCRIYSYGNRPLLATLRQIDTNYLADYPDTTDYAKLTKVPSETRWESEKRKHISCRSPTVVTDSKKQSTIAIAVLCNDIRAAQDTFTMQIISELLVNGENSEFHKSYIQSKLSSSFAPLTGYDPQTRDSFFSVGVSNTEPKDFDKIIDVYNKTVEQIVENGFDESNVNAVLHTVELLGRQQTATFGLDMLFHLTPVWNHDGDVLKSIKIQDKISKFKKSMSDNALYLQDKVNEYMKSNNHRLVLTMSPVDDFDSDEANVDKEMMEQRLNVLSTTAKDKLYDNSMEIHREEEADADVRSLPNLTVLDLPPEAEPAGLKGYTIQKVPIQVCNMPSNGISYIRGVLNSSILSEDAKNLLPVFCICAARMGTTERTFKQMDQLIQSKTGRFSFHTHIAENIYDVLSYEEGVTFSSMCLDRNIDAMLSLWTNIFTGVVFKDPKRFQTVVKEAVESRVNELTTSGDLYAISVASALISPSSERKEQFGGLQFMRRMKSLATKLNVSEALETMTGIAQVVLSKRLVRIAINTDAATEENMLKSVDKFLTTIPGEFKKSYNITKPASKQGQINSSVHYETVLHEGFAAHCVRTVAYTHKDFPLLRLAARLLTTKYCLPNIRDMGWAAGAGASISTSGVLSLSSFRDTNPSGTFDAFNKAKNWLVAGDGVSNHDLDEAKIGVLQTMDSPVPAGSKGARSFLFGISDDELQRHRKVVMQATKEDVLRVATLIDTNFQGRCFIGSSNEKWVPLPEENWQKRFLE